MADQFHSRLSSPPFGAHGVLAGQSLWPPECGPESALESDPSARSAGLVPAQRPASSRKTKSGKDIQNATTEYAAHVRVKLRLSRIWQYLRAMDSSQG